MRCIKFGCHKKTEKKLNKKIKTLMLVSALAPAMAMAQTPPAGSSITLYGKLDLAVDTVRFSSSPTKAAQTARYLSSDTSFWGLTGSENLGNGLRAYFKLESGFSVDTGANTGGTAKLFDREAYVALGSQWGAIQLGSQYSPSLFVQVKSDPSGRHGNGNGTTLTQQSPGNLQGNVGAVTLDNAIQYISPNISGVSARLLYSLSEKSVAPKDLGEFSAVSVDYVKGPLFVGVAYENQAIASVTPVGLTRPNITLSAGATYDFSVVKVYGYLMKNRLAPNDANTELLGLTYPFGASMIRTSYAQRKTDNVDGSKARILMLGYDYNLSKRTLLYTSFARLINGTATNFNIWPSSKTYAATGLPGAGQDINSLELGIRHTF